MRHKSLLVNLDALISRADFAELSNEQLNFDRVQSLPIKELSRDGLFGKILRKPDFQRETNHWTPNQILSLIKCFLDGDLIPSVILWKSNPFTFVIDGGHRISALKAWTEDDYGDGALSRDYFGDEISKNQRKAAEETRKLINSNIGSYSQFQSKIQNSNFDNRAQTLLTRGLTIQWVDGNSSKAEDSFFRINSQGTPLDDLEETLLKNRNRPIAISTRAVIRAGKGHKYWSKFPQQNADKIEEYAKKLHSTLFDPEVQSPIKTLDLPLGGSKGVRSALQILAEFFFAALLNQTQQKVGIGYGNDDTDGIQTVEVLKKGLKLAQRITGNDRGSLGLHPAVYFYGPTGVHSSSMFLGTASFISEKLANNDKDFFKNFTNCREAFEAVLINDKELIATILQKMISKNRIERYKSLFGDIYKACNAGLDINQTDLVRWAGLSGKIVVGEDSHSAKDFSDETKSKIFILQALKSAMKCPICNGYLDPTKSISYDHVIKKEDGGTGSLENGQLTHPYCNNARDIINPDFAN